MCSDQASIVRSPNSRKMLQRLAELLDAVAGRLVEVVIVPERPQRVRLAAPIADPAIDLERRLDMGAGRRCSPSSGTSGLRGAARDRVLERGVVVRVGDLVLVADRLPERQRPPRSAGPSRGSCPATSSVPPSASSSRARSRGSSFDHGAASIASRRAPRLGQVAVLLPEPPHRERDADRHRRIRLRDGPVERRRGCRRAPARAGRASAADRRPTAGRPPRSRARRTSRGAGRWISSTSPSASRRSAANARIVSRSRKRGSPSAVSSTLIRLWSASAMSPSRTSPPTSSAGPQTASAEVTSQPLAKTDSRSSRQRAPVSSRS